MQTRRIVIGLIGAAALIGWPSPGRANWVVYTSGPTNGTIGAASIGDTIDRSISESFSVTAAVTLTQAAVGLWVYEGDPPPAPHYNTPVGLTWAIGTAPQGTDIGTGSASLTNSFFATNGAWDIYDSTFSFGGTVSLTPGTTYWLTLGDGTATDVTHWPQWDIENFSNGLSPTSIQLGGAEYYPLSFTLYAIPEPCSLALLAVGGVTMLTASRRRRGA